MKMTNYAFRRPYCSPSGGFVLANSPAEAIDLINHAFGYTDTTVYDPETKIKWLGENGKITQVEA